jgi:hypothetical protein
MEFNDFIYSSNCDISENQKDKMNFIIMREMKKIK